MSAPIDFKQLSKNLLQLVAPATGVPVNRELARSAIEVALRDAYDQGKRDARGAPSAADRTITQRNTQRPAPPKAAIASAPAPCVHHWDESFLDGRSVGVICLECGIAQKDVQHECDHYFLKVGQKEVCMACRAPKR